MVEILRVDYLFVCVKSKFLCISFRFVGVDGMNQNVGAKGGILAP